MRMVHMARRRSAGRVPSPEVRFALLAVVIVLFTMGVFVLGVPQPADVAAAVNDSAIIGPVTTIVGSALVLLALVPRSVLAVAAGLAFGPLLGSTHVLAGVALGALLAFVAGRILGRDLVASRPPLSRADAWLTDRGLCGVLILRTFRSPRSVSSATAWAAQASASSATWRGRRSALHPAPWCTPTSVPLQWNPRVRPSWCPLRPLSC